jgi:squalene-hopene/tetraprenyl-beta-curcumene cyclase
LFGQIPWRGVPFIPVEILLLPKWFPFHISKVSYWSRTVMVPLFVLCTMKPRAANPRNVDIGELFAVPPEEERHYFAIRSGLNRAFFWLDRIGRAVEPLVPGAIRRRAIARAEQWVVERLNEEGGLGAIFPAMVNAHEMLATLGYREDHPYRRTTKEALRQLLVVKDRLAYCQPCVSPVWDTGLACLALQAAGYQEDAEPVLRGLDWLARQQLLDDPGDWRDSRPALRGGGWAFQFRNTHYPDIDDTPVIAWAMLQADSDRYAESIERAAEWIVGMQSRNGGWGSFDVDNTHYYLNEIPFADHGALLDPPTADVTARCVTFLSKLEPERFRPAIARALRFLEAEQEPNGSWFGRWGTNYVYGTWSVLVGLDAAGVAPDAPMVRRAVEWLESVQRPDGGWGETNFSYFAPSMAGQHHTSTAFQTAWAVLALMAAGDGASEAVERGIGYLMRRQRSDGTWHDEDFTAPGFPRVFYLKYHGYTTYFPLWALAEYRALGGPA